MNVYSTIIPDAQILREEALGDGKLFFRNPYPNLG